MSAFSPSLSLCCGPLTIVWPPVNALMDIETFLRLKCFYFVIYHQRLDLCHTRKTSLPPRNYFVGIPVQNLPGSTEFCLPAPYPPSTCFSTGLSTSYFLTWVKHVTVVSLMASWQLTPWGYVTLAGFTEAQYFSRDETTHDNSHGIMTYSRSPCLQSLT